MVREVSVCKEAEAEVEADEADAADEAVEVSSEALLPFLGSFSVFFVHKKDLLCTFTTAIVFYNIKYIIKIW